MSEGIRAASKIQTVDELSNSIRGVITSSPVLRNVSVRGEIQNFKRHGSGHVYFTLAGRESKISAVLFRSHASGILAWPEEGDEALVTGSVDVYPKAGAYQLYAARVLPIGLGAQRRARDELRAALDKEGLFDARHKRPLPKYPAKVAVITSPTGAAIRDILEVSSKRAPFIDIVIIPATVQGIDAPIQVVSALASAGAISGVDCVIVARGGGAKDDLSPFDDERLVRAVRNCPLPVVTGVGHQIDSSLADLAADAALPTPSAAAEKVFPDSGDLLRSLEGCLDMLRSHAARRFEQSGSALDRKRDRLFAAAGRAVSDKAKFIDGAEREIARAITGIIEKNEAAVSRSAMALDALSPLAVLARGYSICRDELGQVLKSANTLEPGSRISIRFHEGTAEADIVSASPRGSSF
ncbi:MAG: exodeoxyribonuclease VII large subunit [Synergistaceae bacterium]|jgi:exodeoxyribonuclease VII large subunit|nr:exodeoxyribonuclease VII large subunit [Synergistaceae bacterium]